MLNDEQANKFLKWINDNYDTQKRKLQAFCHDKHYTFDEDIYCDTYLKIHDKIKRTGIADDSEKGFENYLFISFKINTLREAQYSRNSRRDSNVTNIASRYEAFLNKKLTTEEKLEHDLKQDFSMLYILNSVEKQFDGESYYLFRLKIFNKYTYKDIAQKTGIKNARQKVIDVMHWIKDNISKDDINNAFYLFYNDFIG